MPIEASLFELKDFAEVWAGYPFRGGVDEVDGGSVGVIQMRDVEPGGDVTWSGMVKTELEGRRTPDWVETGDVLFVSRGPRFYAACVGPVPMRAVCSPHLFQLRVKPNAPLLPAFLSWQLNQSPLQRQLQSAAEGSNQLSIRRGEMEALTISVPALEDQARIIQLAESARRERALMQSLIANRDKQLDAIALALSGAPLAANHT